MYLGRYYGYYINLTPNDLKLITGILIVVSLVITQLRKQKRAKAELGGPSAAGSNGTSAARSADSNAPPADVEVTPGDARTPPSGSSASRW